MGADNLLRVASTGTEEAEYRHGKMAEAYQHLQKYLASIDPEFIAMDVKMSMLRLVENARLDLRHQVEREEREGGADAYVLSVLVKIAEYIEGQHHRKSFVAIPVSTTADVDRMLSFLFTATFGVVDPSALDELEKGDIERWCEPEWLKVRDANVLSWREFFSMTGSFIRQ